MTTERRRRWRAVTLGACLGLARPLGAWVPGGGLPDADCRVVFDGVTANAGASGVVCRDGDPACDVDGAADGTCRFSVRLCTGVAMRGCDPVTVSEIDTAGIVLSLPPLPSEPERCGATATVDVAADEVAVGLVLARGDGGLRDVDYLNLCCRRDTPDRWIAARCALRPALASGECGVPRRAVRAWVAAGRALGAPSASRAAIRKARRKLDRVRALARARAAEHQCANGWGLMARHAADVLAALDGGR